MAISRALGTTISKGGTLIGGLTSINGVSLTSEKIQKTTLDSTGRYREYLQGFKDAGEVTMEGFLNPSATGQTEILTAFESGTTDTYVITFPSTLGAGWTFTGYVSAIETGAPGIDDLVTFNVTVTVTGEPTYGTTVSAGLSDLVVSGTTSTLAPTFATGTYFYTHTFNTDTTITVTPTGASHTIKLYVDDIYIEDVTSGAASSAIAFSALQTRELRLIVYEDSKTPLTYTVMSNRTA